MAPAADCHIPWRSAVTIVRMKRTDSPPRRWPPAVLCTAALLLGCATAPDAAAPPPAAPPAATRPASLGAGLRRSSYGLPAKNADDAWWIARAKAFAAGFPGARPVIVQIVSTYQD